MYINCQKYQVMPGEPHLGTMTECELIASDEEVFDLIVDYAIDEGEIPEIVIGIDDITEEDIEIEVSDYVDDRTIELVNWYLSFFSTDEPDRDIVHGLVSGEMDVAFCKTKKVPTRLTIYPEDYAKLHDWEAVCDQLGVKYDSAAIHMDVCNVEVDEQ